MVLLIIIIWEVLEPALQAVASLGLVAEVQELAAVVKPHH
jgi:hypothetical protein